MKNTREIFLITIIPFDIGLEEFSFNNDLIQLILDNGIQSEKIMLLYHKSNVFDHNSNGFNHNLSHNSYDIGIQVHGSPGIIIGIISAVIFVIFGIWLCCCRGKVCSRPVGQQPYQQFQDSDIEGDDHQQSGAGYPPPQQPDNGYLLQQHPNAGYPPQQYPGYPPSYPGAVNEPSFADSSNDYNKQPAFNPNA